MSYRDLTGHRYDRSLFYKTYRKQVDARPGSRCDTRSYTE